MFDFGNYFRWLGSLKSNESDISNDYVMVVPGNLSAEFCLNRLDPNIEPWKGAIIEAVFTSILILLVCSGWDRRNAGKDETLAIRLGIAVIVLVTAGGKLTGCSMNPARSFAPALLSSSWQNHWVYWLGPLLGSLLMTILYKHVFLEKGNSSKILNENYFENEPLTKKNNIVLETASMECYNKSKV